MVNWNYIWDDYRYHSFISEDRIKEMSKLLEDGVLVMSFIKVSDVQAKVYDLLEEQFLSLKNTNNYKNEAGNILIDIIKVIKDENIQDTCFELSKKVFTKHGDWYDIQLTKTHEEVAIIELKDSLSTLEYNNKKLFSKVGNAPDKEIDYIIERILMDYQGQMTGQDFLDEIINFFTFPRYIKVAQDYKKYFMKYGFKNNSN